MRDQDLQRAIGPLRWIFAGGLICLLDFTINGFDFLPDLLGVILIAAGVFTLAGIEVHQRYRSLMTALKIIVVFQALHALIKMIGSLVPDPAWMLMNLISAAGLVGCVLFCIAMQWFCEEARLERSQESFRITKILFLVIYAVPLGLFHISSTFFALSDTSFNFNLGLAAIPLLLVFFVPVVHLFISTSRMAAESKNRTLSTAPLPG